MNYTTNTRYIMISGDITLATDSWSSKSFIVRHTKERSIGFFNRTKRLYVEQAMMETGQSDSWNTDFRCTW